MLTIIRKYTGNIIFKIIFGIIVLSFAVFFGTSNMLDGSSDSNRFGVSPANVNDNAISAQRFRSIVENQMASISENNKSKEQIPPEYVQLIKQKVVSLLVSRELIRQFLSDAGLDISKKELAEHIKGMENFSRDGKFDFDYYNNEYLKGYQLRNGSSFEDDIRNDLSTKQFFDHFEQVLEPTPEEIDALYTLGQTLYQYSFVRVAKKEILDESSKDTKIQTTATETAKQKATAIHTLLKNGGDIKEELAKLKLELKDTKEINASQIVKSVFGGVANVDNLKILIALTQKSPMPTDIIDEGNYFYVIKLTSLKQSNEKIDDETRAQFTKAYEQDWSQLLEEAFLKDLQDKAKVTINKDAFAQ